MNIVVVRSDALGDSLVTFPILLALREKYTNCHITFVGNPGAIPLAKAWNIADEMYNYDTQWAEIFSPEGIRQSRLLALFQQTDLAISWAEDIEPPKQNLLKAGAREVTMVPVSYSGLTQISNDPLHMVEYVAQWIGLPSRKPECTILPNIGSEVFIPYNPPIAIHPGSGSAYIRWPVTSFADIIVSLMRQQYPVLLLGGPSEDKLLKELRLEVYHSDPRLSRSGLLAVLQNAPLLEVTQRLKQCGCFVGHDTGTTHLAALLRIPTLALFGDTRPILWRPLGPTVEVIHELKLERLSTKRVLESVLRMYNGHR